MICTGLERFFGLPIRDRPKSSAWGLSELDGSGQVYARRPNVTIPAQAKG